MDVALLAQKDRSRDERCGPFGRSILEAAVDGDRYADPAMRFFESHIIGTCAASHV
jgi:hypothetical protein